jgi:hypothetical protein
MSINFEKAWNSPWCLTLHKGSCEFL